MEIKKCSHESLMNQGKKIKEDIKDILKFNENDTQYASNLWGTMKTLFSGMFLALNDYIKKL